VYAWVGQTLGLRDQDSCVAREAGPFDALGVPGNLLWQMQLRRWCQHPRFKLCFDFRFPYLSMLTNVHHNLVLVVLFSFVCLLLGFGFVQFTWLVVHLNNIISLCHGTYDCATLNIKGI